MAVFNNIPGNTPIPASTAIIRNDADTAFTNRAVSQIDNTSDLDKPVSTAQQAALNLKQDSFGTGTTSQYLRGDLAWTTLNAATVGLGNVNNTSDANKPISTATQTALDAKANISSLATVATTGSYSDLSGKPTLATVATSGAYNDLTGKPTLGSAAAANTTDFATATQGTLANSAVQPGSLATVATSGSYTDLTSKPTIPAAQVNSDWNASSGIAQILNKPSIGTGSVTSVGVSSTDFSVSGSPVTTSGSITLNLNTSGVSAGTYSGVTVTSKGIVTAGTNRTFTVPTRTLNTAFQISTTQDTHVSYAVDISVTSLLLAGTQGTVTLQYADNSGFTTNVVTVDGGTNATGGVLNVSNTGTVKLTAIIPANKYVKIITANTQGTPTFSIRSSQEVLL